jgi:translation elongation factor EF-G
MVFKVVTGVVAGVITRVFAGVVARGDEVYHHSSAQVIARGVRAHLNARGPLLPSC